MWSKVKPISAKLVSDTTFKDRICKPKLKGPKLLQIPSPYLGIGSTLREKPRYLMGVGYAVDLVVCSGTNCIKIGLPGKQILSKRKGLREVLFS